jgi:hypothetical protein
MNSAELQTVLRVRPFRPFLLRLVDGGTLPVPTVDHIAHAERLVFVVGSDGAHGVIEMAAIVGVEYMTSPSPRRGIGLGGPDAAQAI